MNTIPKIPLLLTGLIMYFGYNPTYNDKSTLQDDRIKVEFQTTQGQIILELYNETPLHRDNFVKLVEDGAYDGLLFHRVIEEFMIQGGDPDSRKASANTPLGDGDIGYTVPAEFRPDLFHRKGSLATARDQNKTRASSGIQIFIVQGKVQNDSLLEVAEKRINRMLSRHHAWNDPEVSPLFDSVAKFQKKNNKRKMSMYRDSLEQFLETYDNFDRYTIPEEHRKVYKTVGGTPHLDQNYTVFGRVVSGIEVVDSIAAVPTDKRNRPKTDVRILSATIIE